MEFEPSVALWRGRGSSAAIDASAVNGKDGSKLVLVTTRDEVLEYCTQARKCVHHWTFRSNLALRLGAVRNPLSQVLFGVRGAKKAGQPETIVAWRNSDLEVAKWKTATLSDASAVTGLYVHPQLTEEVVVVFANGKFAVYDEDLTKLLDASDATGAVDESVDGHVAWAALASDHRNPAKGALFLSLLVKASSGQYELVVYQVFSKKDRKDARVAAALIARQAITLPSSNSSAVGSTTNAAIASAAFHAETFSYSFVWTTGAWQMVTFEHNAVARELTCASSQLVATLGAELTALTPTHKKRKLAASASGPVAGLLSCGVGNFSYLVVSNASNPKALTGWDAKFGVQVAATELDFSAPDAAGGEDVTSAPPVGAMLKLLSSLNGEVVVAAYEHAVFFVTVKNKHSTLASVLGAAASSSSSMVSAAPGLPNRAIDWSDVAAKSVSVAAWKDTLCTESAVEEQFIRELADASVTATAAQFTKKFDDALQALHAGGRELSYRFLVAVAKRCVESEKLALWAPLRVALASKRISARAVPALLPTLMRANQFELLELAIRDLSDLDERSVVRLLKFFIRKSDDKALATYVAAGGAAKSSSGSNKRKKPSQPQPTATGELASERFLVALLALPTNNVFLHHAIRELQLEDVLFLIAICKKLFFALAAGADVGAVSTTTQPKQQQPSALQLCSWICALVDGHFAQLVLAASKDAKVGAALRSLDTLVQRQLQSCEQFEGVQSVLSNFLSGVKLPQAHGIPDYSIEELII